MKVHVNGEARTLSQGMTVAGLLEMLSLPGDGVAVAVNLDVVPRGQHGEHVLVEGDRVEIIRAVGGG